MEHTCPHTDRPIRYAGLCNACYEREWAATTKKPIKHGTYYAYTRRKCRCEKCTKAKRDYQNENR